MSAVSPSISSSPFGDHAQLRRHGIHLPNPVSSTRMVAMFNPLDVRSQPYGDRGSNANKPIVKNGNTSTNAAPCCNGPSTNGKGGIDGSHHQTIPSSAKAPGSVSATSTRLLGMILHGQNSNAVCHPYNQSSRHTNTNGGQDLSIDFRADSQPSGNGPVSVPNCEASSGTSRTPSVIALPDSDYDMIERLCASINKLQDKIANKWDHYHNLHRHLPLYDAGPVIRPQLFPNTTPTSIFKGRSSPPDIPKPAAPRPPLKVLPLHGLSGTGIISVYDCQHMYRAGRVGKHDDLQKIYFDVDNAPKNQSHRIDWGNLRPLLQTPPKDYQDIVEAHNVMLGMTHKLNAAEPGIAVSAPKGTWEKETIGCNSQADLAQTRKERVQNNTASYVKACVSALEALGVTEFHGDLIHGLDRLADSQAGTNGHDTSVGDLRGYTNGGHQPMRLTLPAVDGLDGDHTPRPSGNTSEHRPRMKRLHRATTGDHQGAVKKYHATMREHLETTRRSHLVKARDNNTKVDANGSMNEFLDPSDGDDGVHTSYLGTIMA